MTTCSHCLNYIPQTEEEIETVTCNAEAEFCPCITADCGHRLCSELNDHPPCSACGQCECCCLCVCDICGQAFRADEECMTCVNA
jgi:hypothetical protein